MAEKALRQFADQNVPFPNKTGTNNYLKRIDSNTYVVSLYPNRFIP
jgi:hypothetical protein